MIIRGLHGTQRKLKQRRMHKVTVMQAPVEGVSYVIGQRVAYDQCHSDAAEMVQRALVEIQCGSLFGALATSVPSDFKSSSVTRLDDTEQLHLHPDDSFSMSVYVHVLVL